MQKLTIIIAALILITLTQCGVIVYLYNKLDSAQAKADTAIQMADAAFQVAIQSRALSFESKRIAEANKTVSIPPCKTEEDRHGVTYKSFMGGK